MRRILAVILCVFLLSTTVYADNAATSVNTVATVQSDGSCRITLNAIVRLDEAVSKLTFPIGKDVRDVTLNGSRASLTRTNGITAVKLDHLAEQEGIYQLTIQFTARDLVTEENDGTQYITVPLLYGFPYPVEDMSFSITLPGEFQAAPSFYSGYHEQEIETRITYSVDGTTVSGDVDAILKDSETLVMELRTPEGMFPHARTGNAMDIVRGAMIACAVLALAYWLVTMRYLPGWPTRRATTPEGISAGNLGSYLAKQPMDFPMQVVQWAQMGYLIIHLDENGRVMLHKKMEMGNERSTFEQSCFKLLFPKHPQIDATSFRFARICDRVTQRSRRHSAGFRTDSGNPMIFRWLGCGAALFAGAVIGDSLLTHAVWRVVLAVATAIAAALACRYIQEDAKHLLLRGSRRMLRSLAIAVCLVAWGHICGQGGLALGVAVWSFATGIAGFYGGRRTDGGNQLVTQIIGLRRYMCKVSKPELLRILRSNPDYYFELAPYAMALGVDRQFARRFEDLHMSSCTWLVTGLGSHRTAAEWYPLLRATVDAMNTQPNTASQTRPPHR